MESSNNFSRFCDLPAELRLRVWEEALSLPAVWAAVAKICPSKAGAQDNLHFVMRYIGPAPYMAGLATREARRLMERLYAGHIHGSKDGPTACVPYHWVNLNTTVVYLGNSFQARATLDGFEAHVQYNFKHVALKWYHFGDVARVCKYLAGRCPLLCTIIIQRTETRTQNRLSHHSLSLGTATYYATVLEYGCPEANLEEFDATHFRSLVQQYFGDSPPMVHLLAPEMANLP